jgi:hypothetical protein
MKVDPLGHTPEGAPGTPKTMIAAVPPTRLLTNALPVTFPIAVREPPDVNPPTVRDPM